MTSLCWLTEKLKSHHGPAESLTRRCSQPLADRTVSLPFIKTRPLQATLVHSLALLSGRYPGARLCRLPAVSQHAVSPPAVVKLLLAR